MLKSAYTSVAEFHYLHHDERCNASTDPAEMAVRIVAASVSAGIGLTMLPASAVLLLIAGRNRRRFAWVG